MSKLVIALGEEPTILPLSGQPITIGRAPDNVVVIDRPNISRRHAMLEPVGGGVYRLVDLDSTNGTYLNGEPVTRMALEFDDRIVVGQTLMMYLADEADVMDALETSGVVFPWRPVQHRDDPTPVAGTPPVGSPSSPAADWLEDDPMSETVGFRQTTTAQYPIDLNTRSRAVYLKELLPRLSRVGQNVASEMDLGRLMTTILTELARWTGCQRAVLMLYDEDTGLLQPVIGHRVDYDDLTDVERRFIDRVVKQTLDRKSLVLRTGIRLTRDAAEVALGIPRTLDTCLCLPLTVPVRLGGRERRRPGRMRRSLGAIYLDSSEPIQELEPEVVQLLEAIGAQAVTALQNAQLHYQATTDPMTRLYNRMFMWQVLASELEAARSDGGQVGLILLDLDRLKRINDTWGHAAGDEVIKRVARRIRHAIRKEDYASRWGGEEFLVVLLDQPPHGIATVAQKIREAINSRPIGEQQLRVSASMGIACFPHHASNPDELIRSADAALYEAKEAGRDRIKLFNKDGFE